MERRISERVKFGHGPSVRIMALDGSWRRRCVMEDVSEVGAKLTVDGSVSELDLKEFLLVLSTTGQAHRRCEVVWTTSNQIGVRFLKPVTASAPPKSGADALVG